MQQKVTENEAVFRQLNESVQKGFQQLSDVAKQEGHKSFQVIPNKPLHFYCECSDEDCHQHIVMEPDIYDAVHRNRDKFTVICGHETTEYEEVVERTAVYCVVQKFITPPEDAKELHETDIDNDGKSQSS